MNLQRWPVLLLAALVLGGLFLDSSLGCESQPSDGTPARPVANVVATDSALEVRDTVPAGWVTFRMTNEGSAHHSFKLRKLPGDQTFEDYRRGLFAPADSLEAALIEGRIDSAAYRKKMRQAIPRWFGQVTTVGGITGLAPGETARITHKLEPGQYVLSCLFRTPKNRTHALLGVRAGLQVREDSSGAPPPTADLTARLSPSSFEVDTSALADQQVIEFRSEGGPEGNPSPWAGLFRLTSETGAEDVVRWMDAGIPLPAPTDWIGGPEPMPAGNVAYVHVGDLPQGRYAWITEVAPDTSGRVKTFRVGGR